MPEYDDIPGTVWIGVFRYKVEVDREKIDWISRGEGQNLDGFADHSQMEITLNPNLAPQMIAAAFLHEILHAIWVHSGLDHDDLVKVKDIQETVVSAITPSLMGLLINNPDTVRYLTKVNFD